MRDLRNLAGCRHRSRNRWISLRALLPALRQSGTWPSQLSRKWVDAFQDSFAFVTELERQGKWERRSVERFLRSFKVESETLEACVG